MKSFNMLNSFENIDNGYKPIYFPEEDFNNMMPIEPLSKINSIFDVKSSRQEPAVMIGSSQPQIEEKKFETIQYQ